MAILFDAYKMPPFHECRDACCAGTVAEIKHRLANIRISSDQIAQEVDRLFGRMQRAYRGRKGN